MGMGGRVKGYKHGGRVDPMRRALVGEYGPEEVKFIPGNGFLVKPLSNGSCGTVVKNLTVTYLCRKESKQEDTTQQRGRFYGYKKKYKEYIRVFTTGENSRFFGDYVLAEKTMWQNLQDHIETGKSFDELDFSPIVVKDFKLTRDNVHEKLILNTDKQNWVIPNGPHFDNVRNFNER